MHYCQRNIVFLKGKVKRCKNDITTLIISTYHPLLLQWQVPFAIIQCKSEDAAIFGMLWDYFKETFKEANKTTEKTTASSWKSDMVVANFNALQLLYSKELLSKVKDFELHFCQSVNQYLSKYDNIDTFKVFSKISILSYAPFYWPMQSRLFNNSKFTWSGRKELVSP